MRDSTPDHADDEFADLIDDAVPTRGYELTPLVGLGGSAGAIPALQTLMRAFPADCGLAFVVVMHLSPEHESTLPELLQRCTTMPVLQATASQPVKAGCVYVIPPAKAIRAVNGRLELADDRLTPRGRHVAIDLFFRKIGRAHV